MNTNQNLESIPLTPLLHTWVEDILVNNQLIHAAIEEYGSPINIHSLRPFEENIKAYKDVFLEMGLKHKIYFARKANKCIAFPIAATECGEGADTASYRELKECIDAGINAEHLILTAAVKNKRLIELAVEQNVTVVLDNLDEWDLLKEVVSQKNKCVRINVRLGGFYFDDKILPTRFGFSLEDAFQFIKELHNNEPLINFTGLHFHLNGYSVEHRAAAVEQSLQLIDRLSLEQIKTESLDIGGGYLMNYLSEKSQWEYFNKELKRAVLGEREPITYQNDTLGMIKVNNKLYGEPTVYPYYNELYKSIFLKAILSSYSAKYNQLLFKLIEERNIEVRMEPGRSLLDQCGITAAKVAFRKKDTDGNWLFGLEMNRTQLRSSSADFLLDPIHIPKATEKDSREAVSGFLVGAYCLEQELILRRKITFLEFPEVGDLVVFPNTAGYMMHFFESEAHLFELAKNLIFKDQILHCCDDLKD